MAGQSDSNSILVVPDIRIDHQSDGDDDEVFKKHNLEKNHHLVISRQWFTKSEFDVAGGYVHHKPSRKDKLITHCSKCCPRSLEIWKARIISLFPFIGILRSYGKSDLFCDIISGLTVGVMHIPQGMAYGILANIDPVYGLYTSFFSIFIYFIFGTSRHISIGVFAVVSLMIGNVVDKADCSSSHSSLSNPSTTISLEGFTSPMHDEFLFGNSSTIPTHLRMSDDEEECKVRHALAVTFTVGVIQLVMGILQCGFITVYLSDPLTRGLTTGAGVHVLTSQIKHVFGISDGKFDGPLKLVFMYKKLFEEIKNTNLAPLFVSLVCIVIIYCLQRWVSPRLKKSIKIPLPVELLVLIFGTLISHFCKFSSPDVFKMKVVGKIPQGIPVPRPPDVFLIPRVALDAVAIAIVSFTINISMAKMFSTKHGYNLESNQELVAYGLTNSVCSFFNSYVSTASLSRTLVQESTGGKTQVAGLISSMLLLVVLLFVGPLFHDLPNCVLAAVIIVNLRGIFLQVTDLIYLKKISRADMWTWIVTCVAVVLTDVDLGLFIGLSFSFLTVVLRNQSPKVRRLGNVLDTEFYEDMEEYREAKEINGIKIFSVGTSLFYANSEYFQTKIEDYLFTEKCEVEKENVQKMNETNEMHSYEHKLELALECSKNLIVARNTKYKSIISDVIIDCGKMAFIDDVGIKTLNLITTELSKRKIRLSLAHCSNELSHTIRKAMELKKLVKCQMFLTVHDAVTCISDLYQ